MRSRSISPNSDPRSGITRFMLIVAGLASLCVASIPDARAFDLNAVGPVEQIGRDLYLEIFINGTSRQFIAEVHEDADGSLSIDPVQLRNVGILPGNTQRADGRVNLAGLSNVVFEYDELLQTLSFTASDAERAALVIVADGTHGKTTDPAAEPKSPQADLGGLLNYSLYGGASYDAVDESLIFGELSGAFEARIFGPFGLVNQTFAVLGSSMDVRRLDSTWSYADPNAMRTYRAGDVVTGALSWSRPTRLGGVQIQNSFGLRPDIVTSPVPGFSGSAALPSSVEVYLNNARRFSSDVPAGPFEIVDLPVVSGAGTVQIVVRDEHGQEVVTESDYFVSERLLKPGLSDYSAELGFARTQYGTDYDTYDRRLMGSASLRHGITDWLTGEAHVEGGPGLINLGVGGVAALGHWGIGSLAAAGSSTDLGLGLQVTGSVQFELGDMNIEARAQRTFGDFNDIASVTFNDTGKPGVLAGEPPRAIYQLSLSLPLPFDASRMSLSYTQLETGSGDPLRLAGATLMRPVLGGSLSASAFANLDDGNYGLLASVSMPIGEDISSSASMTSGPRGSSVTSNISHSAGDDVGDVGWRLRYGAGENPHWSAAASTQLTVAEMAARVRHSGDHTQASAEVSGSIVMAGGDVFLANRIGDAFAIVDVGVSAVPVLFENRPAGETAGNGKLLLPNLRSYQNNRIAIDPSGLPLDVVIASTRQTAIPADRSGVVVRFANKTTGGAALVILRDEAGVFLALGTTGQSSDDTLPFMVGYDGEALIEGLGPDNRITLQRPDGSQCRTQFAYAPQGGAQVVIADVVCHPV